MSHPQRRAAVSTLFTGLLAMLVALGVLVVANGPNASAAPDGPSFGSFTYVNGELVYASSQTFFAADVEIDVPRSWVFDSSTVTTCANTGSNCSSNAGWLTRQGSPVRRNDGPAEYMRIAGTVPQIPYGVSALRVQVSATYVLSTDATQRKTISDVWVVAARGGTDIAFTPVPDAQLGQPITVSGSVRCFGANGGYFFPNGRTVNLSWLRATGEPVPFSTATVRADGSWSAVLEEVNSTHVWRATFGWDVQCAVAGAERTITITNGTGGPIQQPGKPDAPGFNGYTSTQTTATIDWTKVPGATGYIWGWTSDNGKPVKNWELDYSANAANPFTLTNLSPGTGYDVYIITKVGDKLSDRREFRVVTKAAPVTTPPTTPPPTTPPPTNPTTPPPTNPTSPPPTSPTTSPTPTPPPGLDLPTAPRRVRGKPAHHKAIITWRAPRSDGGARINRYQAHRFNTPASKDVKTNARTLRAVFTHLRPGLTYSFYVRAHTRAGWGPWSKTVQVHPR